MKKSQRQARLTSAEMFPLVERYESGGQQQKEFCEFHDINIGTFQYGLKKYREERSTKEPHSFQKITVLPESSESCHKVRHILINTLCGLEIKIPID